MKSSKTILCLLLSLVIVICLCGCSSNTITLDLNPSVDYDAVALYESARDAVSATQHWKLNIVSTKTITMSSNTYEESYVQSLSYSDYGKDSMGAHSSAIHTCGENRIYLEEFYDTGILYASINGNQFCGAMDASTYAGRFVPAVLISPDNYKTVFIRASATGSMITFADAIAPEPWCNVEADALKYASGSIELDAEGNLTESTYSFCYAYGDVEICQSITTRFYAILPNDVKQVTATESYLSTDHPLLPVQLENAAGYLAQANSVSSFIQETSISQATDMHYNFTTQIQMADADANLRASVSYESTLIDYSRDGESITTQQSEQFEGGEYTYKDSVGELQTDTSVNEAAMKEHLLNLLVQNIATPDHIISASTSVTDTTEILEFTMDEDMAQHLKQYACEALSMDASLLDSLAQSFRTDYVQGTLTLDRITGFPSELTIHYAAEHIIEGQAYRLTYELKQTFDFNISY